MDVGRCIEYLKKTGIHLVFFYFGALIGCRDAQGGTPPEVLYENNSATAVCFMANKVPGSYQVYLSGERQTPVLGTFSGDGPMYTFKPGVPFNPGSKYIIMAGTDTITVFEVIRKKSGRAPPELLAIYPARDTIPENLLKCYLQFSRPMEAVGRALDHIKVTRGESGEEVSVFLDMPAELWNEDHSQLTLWFDPGRIKSGLIPNKTLGKPLEEGKSYEITISAAWRAADGATLKKEYKKTYYAGPPDKLKPNPAHWILKSPRAGTTQPFILKFEAPVDTFIAREAMALYHDDYGYVPGLWEVAEPGTALSFIPDSSWEAGQHTLVIDARMEDLAGNNLNRLFDTNLDTTVSESKPLIEVRKPFVINY